MKTPQPSPMFRLRLPALWNDRGLALLSALFVVVGLLLLTTTLFYSLFLDGQAASNLSAGDDALYVAEAGIQHLWSVLDRAPDFARELAWPNGEPPFASPTWFPAPPRTYRVKVSQLADGSLRAISEGTSHRGARRRVEAVFHHQPSFRPPAALTIGGGLAAADLSGPHEVSFADGRGEVPALGAETRDAADLIRRAGSSGQVAVTGESGLAEAVARLAPHADRTLDGVQGDGVWGTSDRPELTRLAGQAEIQGTVSAAGILLAEAPLRVHGRLEVEGLLLAAAGVEIDGELVVRGALWIDREIRIAGSGRISVVYSTPPLDRGETLAPGILPKAPLLGAWREVW